MRAITAGYVCLGLALTSFCPLAQVRDRDRDAGLEVILGQRNPWSSLPRLPDPETDQRRQQIIERAAAEYTERELLKKMGQFAENWNALVDERRDHGSWNVKKLQAVCKAWKALERSEGWKVGK